MITLTLTTEEADALHEALGLAQMERINQMVPASDPRLAVLARVLELIEAETVEGMIERGEIEQGALAIFEGNLASNAAAYEEAQHPHSAQAAFPCDDCGNSTPVSEHCGGPTTDAERLQCQAKGEEPYLCADCYGIRKCVNLCLAEEPPAYTCPRCHRGMMQGATAHGDGWYHMECPDCGHTEEREAD